MKVELKHLSPYLPYNLQVSAKTRHDKEERIGRVCELTIRSNHSDWVKVWFDDVYEFINTNTYESSASNSHYFFYKQDVIKPILRPLSELYKTDGFSLSKMITHGYHNTFWSKEKFSVNHLYYHDLLILLEWHFDVFGLIDEGLAIDINNI